MDKPINLTCSSACLLSVISSTGNRGIAISSVGCTFSRGSHVAFPRRVWASGSLQCRLFMPLRWAGSLLALLCIHLRLQRHKCMFYLCHPVCTLFYFLPRHL